MVIAVAWPEGVEYILTVRFLRTAWFVAAGGAYLYAAAIAGQIFGHVVAGYSAAARAPGRWTWLQS